MDSPDTTSTRWANPAHAGSYGFGPFVLDPLRRTVWREDGTAVTLTARLFNALLQFVEHPGELLHKDRLMTVLWPGMVVEENSLSQVISALRRALGDDGRRFIRTEARRGFRFVCPVTARPPQLPCPAENAAQAQAGTIQASGTSPHGAALAVLPLVNIDNDPAQDYFVAGMMEELVAALTRIRSLSVIASGSTIALSGESLPPQILAQRLGVRYILEGSVRRAGTRVRIAVRLTDAGINTQIWAQVFDDALEDIFALQDRVALQVAGVIEPKVRAAEMRRAARAPLQHLGCYDLYLRAAQLRMSLSREQVLQALELLDLALRQDPEFAPALAQAAGCHSLICVNGWACDPDPHRRQGLALVERALRVCDDDAAVLAQLANALMDLEPRPGANIDRALALIARATALNPGLAFAWFIGGVLHLIDGNGVAAEEHLLRAMQLDPVSQLHETARAHLGLALAVQGRYEQAVAELRTASNLSPRGRLCLACLHGEIGELREARAELQRYAQQTAVPPETMVTNLSRCERLHAVMCAALGRILTGDHADACGAGPAGPILT